MRLDLRPAVFNMNVCALATRPCFLSHIFWHDPHFSSVKWGHFHFHFFKLIRTVTQRAEITDRSSQGWLLAQMSQSRQPLPATLPKVASATSPSQPTYSLARRPFVVCRALSAIWNHVVHCCVNLFLSYCPSRAWRPWALCQSRPPLSLCSLHYAWCLFVLKNVFWINKCMHVGMNEQRNGASVLIETVPLTLCVTSGKSVYLCSSHSSQLQNEGIALN